ncbi:hypothetical protein SELMODRAFT_112121 [Selaginella moellendorffii]|uniref:Pentacotripeptide-repeat region of PRORP domain-containing protein n=2 Tax=Selaginella moellendorffii TaxID=88036 RepID=D8S9C1_SELML|nr:hypothetical protein SELMODRAFT_112121 [Selaginella moellendorffii]
MPQKDVVAWSSMLSSYAQNGHLREVGSLFYTMPEERDQIAWSSIIAAFAQFGHIQDSIKLFKLMVLEGVEPEKGCVRTVLSACSHIGLLQEGWNLFVSMRDDFGIEPSREQLCCVIDILGRAGKINQAQQMVESFSFVPNAAELGTLLGASRLHFDTSCGRQAATQLLQGVDPSNSAAFVGLADLIFAS